jgi:hypothetical protein
VARVEASDARAQAAAQAALEAAWAAIEDAMQEMAEASEAQARAGFTADLASLQGTLERAERSLTTADAFAAAVAAAAKGARRQLHAKGDSSALERQELHLKLEAADASTSGRLKLAAAAAQQQHDTALAGLRRTVSLAEARACDASREAEALQAAKAALQGRAAILDRNLQLQTSELAAVRQEQKKAGQVAGAARALEQLKAAAAEQWHCSAHVESSEGALEAVEQRAQVAEDEQRAKAEELWEHERRCVEAEGEVGGLEADLEAVAQRAVTPLLRFSNS